MASLVNISNAHTGGFLSSNQGAFLGCGGKGGGVNGCGVKIYRGLTGQSGGKRRRKRRTKKRTGKKRRRKRGTKNCRKRHAKSRKRGKKSCKKRHTTRRKRGGATMENLNPSSGIDAFITRGSNGTRSEGLSNSELKTMRGGDGYGMTTESAYGQAHAGSPQGLGRGFHKSAGVPIDGYKSCGLLPDFKLGAGRNYTSNASIQKGAGKSVAAYNQYGPSEYGYTRPGVDGNRLYAGSYAPITNLSASQQCGGRKKVNKSRKHKKREKRAKDRKSVV